jgi:5-methyltetrahydropteroyltriglutamate--homocysteine methyltransferase
MSSIPVSVAVLGTPRIGPRRELKTALEAFWAGRIDETELRSRAAALRAANWARQHGLGIDRIPSNDFAFYDHVLDTALMVGAVPEIYGWNEGPIPLPVQFAMARGNATAPAMEMTKWFDTNYHYIVPEFERGQVFRLASAKPVDEYREAKALGIHTRPVLLGPVTFLALGKGVPVAFDTLTLLDRLLPVYAEVLERLAAEGADWVQIDEPILTTNTTPAIRAALRTAYTAIRRAVPGIRVMLTTYFGDLGDDLDTVLGLPVAGVHLDLARGPGQLKRALAAARPGLVLSLGVIDGRNVWRADLPENLDRIEPAARERPGRIEVASSCSLLHVPVDLDAETTLDPELRSWLAFAAQKMRELAVLGGALNDGRASVSHELLASAHAAATRRTSPRIHNPAVARRAAEVTPAQMERASPYPQRRAAQRARSPLPLFPTTTIGSFPQTKEVREARAAHGRGNLGESDYAAFLRRETETAIRRQEELGLDVLVHGEFERNDMVQYFGERLEGYAFTTHGWVQSYGSRCVRPPIIFGDVARPAPMTVEWASYAQSLTERPMKGMLTGPVTMLQWSFVRDDLDRSEVCRQIALALRDEVTDLERAGIGDIQIDEPALREGLPLRAAERPAYLAWAVEAFRLSASGVGDATRIHTHMCYAEFNDIIEAIAAMDADVISIETSRSRMELLTAFESFHYPNEIGPGVWDIHSPRVPGVEAMADLLRKAARRIDADRLWVNPDCGLKTRGWEETLAAARNMVAAARILRAEAA